MASVTANFKTHISMVKCSSLPLCPPPLMLKDESSWNLSSWLSCHHTKRPAGLCLIGALFQVPCYECQPSSALNWPCAMWIQAMVLVSFTQWHIVACWIPWLAWRSETWVCHCIPMSSNADSPLVDKQGGGTHFHSASHKLSGTIQGQWL